MLSASNFCALAYARATAPTVVDSEQSVRRSWLNLLALRAENASPPSASNTWRPHTGKGARGEWVARDTTMSYAFHGVRDSNGRNHEVSDSGRNDDEKIT